MLNFFLFPYIIVQQLLNYCCPYPKYIQAWIRSSPNSRNVKKFVPGPYPTYQTSFVKIDPQVFPVLLLDVKKWPLHDGKNGNTDPVVCGSGLVPLFNRFVPGLHRTISTKFPKIQSTTSSTILLDVKNGLSFRIKK